MSDQIGVVVMTVPASADHIRFARLLVSGMADKVGFDYEAVEDLRIAVHEACVYLVNQVEAGQDIHLRVVGRADGIEIGAVTERPVDRPPAPIEALSHAIVSAVVDEASFDASPGMLGFVLGKRLEARP